MDEAIFYNSSRLVKCKKFIEKSITYSWCFLVFYKPCLFSSMPAVALNPSRRCTKIVQKQSNIIREAFVKRDQNNGTNAALVVSVRAGLYPMAEDNGACNKNEKMGSVFMKHKEIFVESDISIM